MLVIRSKEINKQLEKGSRQILKDGFYNNPYHVDPIPLTKGKTDEDVFNSTVLRMGKIFVLIKEKTYFIY